MRYRMGDLVYVPQSVDLCEFEGTRIKTHRRISDPCHLLVVESDDDSEMLAVLYEGSVWHVKSRDVYPKGASDG